MNTYEIRIIRPDTKIPAVFSSSHISDHAAVRRAQTLAQENHSIEVWRGLTGVYAGLQNYAIAS